MIYFHRFLALAGSSIGTALIWASFIMSQMGLIALFPLVAGFFVLFFPLTEGYKWIKNKYMHPVQRTQHATILSASSLFGSIVASTWFLLGLGIVSEGVLMVFSVLTTVFGSIFLAFFIIINLINFFSSN